MRCSPRALTISSLVAITLCGAWLRFDDLAGPSLWLDEMLNVEVIRALDRLPAYAWLTGFERENGPLYFAFHAISLALFEPVEFGMRLPSAIAGTLSLIVIFSVARRLTGNTVAGLVGALLLAVSPFHVYYSREGRPYVLLVLLTLLAIAALLDERGPRSVSLAIILLAAAATAATSTPLLVTVGAVSLFMAWKAHDTRRAWLLSAAIALGSLVAAVLLYGRFDQASPSVGFEGGFARIGAMILNGFSTTAGQNDRLEPIAIAAFIAALVGFVFMCDRRHAFIVGAMTVIPVGVTFAGLVLRNHWFSLRYVIHGLAPFLILVAAGIVVIANAVASRVFRRVPRLIPTLSGLLAITLLTAFLVVPFGAARREPLQRADWRRIASVLVRHAHEEDLVIASSAWSEVSIRFYLRELGSTLEIRNAGESLELARTLIDHTSRSWIVTGGFELGAIRGWACRYFLAARDDEEDARLYYAPGLFDFMTHRATEQERSRFTETFDDVPAGRVGMERGDDTFGTGWYGPERSGEATFRWARRTASVFLPIPSGKIAVLRFRASPVGDGQSLTVTADDATIATVAMTQGPAEYELPLGKSDEPRVAEVTFRFSYESSPESIGVSNDSRPLSAAFEWIEIDAGAGSHVAAPILFHPDGYRDDGVEVTNCVRVAQLSPAARQLLLLRLGYDGDQSEDGAIQPEMLVDAFAPRECLSDSEFVDTLYATLIGRRADSVGRAFYTGSLGAGWPRSKVACMMMESDEFARLYEDPVRRREPSARGDVRKP